MELNRLFIILILVVAIIGISGCIGSDTTNSNSTNTSAQSTNNTVKDSTIFENQYIKFKIPDGLTVEDNSTNEDIEVYLFDGDKLIGEILASSGKNTIKQVAEAEGYKEIIVDGKNAYEYSDAAGIGAYVYLDNNIYLWIDFDTAYPDEYKTVKDSIVVKKNPT